MQAQVFHKILPKEFHGKFFEKNIRTDGRAFGAVRKTVIAHDSITKADGSSMVSIGNTTVCMVYLASFVLIFVFVVVIATSKCSGMWGVCSWHCVRC
jgi:exosome complex RNA-binding protein Rrp42 (RNase PH superfamily)